MTAKPRVFVRHTLTGAVALLLARCGGAVSTPPAVAPPKEDFLRANMDLSVNPGEDFFAYANGAWLKAHPIPASESGLGHRQRGPRGALRQPAQDQRGRREGDGGGRHRPAEDRRLLDDGHGRGEGRAAGRGAAQGGARSDRRDQDRARRASTSAFALRPLGVDAFFGVYVAQDEKNSDEMSVHLVAGRPRPARIATTTSTRKRASRRPRTEYVGHLGRMLKLLGRDGRRRRGRGGHHGVRNGARDEVAQARGPARSARRTTTRWRRRTSPRSTRPRSTGPIGSRAWNLEARVRHRRPARVLHRARADAGEDAGPGAEGLPAIPPRLRVRGVARARRSTTRTSRSTDSVLSGQKEQRPRWKRVLDAEDAAMGMVLGRIFVKEYFPAAAKKRYSDLVEAIRTPTASASRSSTG